MADNWVHDVEALATKIDAEGGPVVAIEYYSWCDPEGWTIWLKAILIKPSMKHSRYTEVGLGQRSHPGPPKGDWEGRRWARRVGSALAARYGVALHGADVEEGSEGHQRWVDQHGESASARRYVVAWRAEIDAEEGTHVAAGTETVAAERPIQALNASYRTAARHLPSPTEYSRLITVTTEAEGTTLTLGPRREVRRFRPPSAEVVELLRSIGDEGRSVAQVLRQLERAHGVPRRRTPTSSDPSIDDLVQAHYDVTSGKALAHLAEWLFDDDAGLDVTDDQLDDILGPYLTRDAWRGPDRG